jgi:dihydrofolate reductase
MGLTIPLVMAVNASSAYKTPSGAMEFKVSEAGRELLKASANSLGAIIAGRRTFDIAQGWGGQHPMGVPVLVLTHNIPEDWLDRKNSTIYFVSGGIESAIKRAREIAGDKDIALSSATTTQQALNAGLLDAIHIDLVPFLLGGGVRLLDHLQVAPVDLELVELVPDTGVTHLTYRIIK